MESPIHLSRRVLHFFLAGCLMMAGLQARIDDNANNLSDVWEVANQAGTSTEADDDGDGFSNRMEEASGTHPRDGRAFPRVRQIRRDAAQRVMLDWQTVAGISYQPMVSLDLGDWRPVGPAIIGGGETQEITLDASSVIASGAVRRTRWATTNWGLATVKSYAAMASPPASLIDDSVTQLQISQSNPNVDNFSEWVRGWIVAPQTGVYTFWIASDDSAEFWLSTDATTSAKVLRCSVNGWTNAQEWTKYPSQQSVTVSLTAGRAYYFEIFHHEGGGGDHVTVAWTRPGMTAGTREVIAGNALASSGQNLGELMAGGARLFFRLDVRQIDSDGDGVNDYEEHLLGLDPLNPTTTPRVADGTSARRTVTSASTVTLGVAVPRAYEEGNAQARFVAFRSGGIGPITVPYQISGTATAGADYQNLSGSVHFSAGARAVPIPVVPLTDGVTEVQEQVTLTLQSGSGYQLGSPVEASVSIDDSADVLYIAQLRSVPGMQSAGRGVAALRKSGNSLTSRCSLSFGGLSAAQTSAELYFSTNQGAGGTTVLAFPPGQVPSLNWDFSAAGGMSREEILQALAEGKLWVRVNTAAAAGAEIIGQLLATPAWQTMPPIETVPPAPTHASSTAEAARFLTQATFGPTESELANLTGNAYATWIDQQIALPASYHRAAMMARTSQWLARGDTSGGWQGPRNETWWQRSLTAPDQLRQRMALALSQIFVISQFGALDGSHEGVTIYYDMLLENAFGNYRDLLEDVTLSPMMGTYLSMMRNRKPDPLTGHEPDENYAREVMQLFSVGLSKTHLDGTLMLDAEGMPLPTYTQEETVGLAHIFTGWGPHYNDADPPRWSNNSVASRNDWFRYGYDSLRPMTFYQDFHDTNERVILGGHVIPAGTDGVDRMRRALDALYQHPNTGTFLAKQLIQKFVTSNPSPGYVARVASAFNNNGSGVRGDLGATIKAVLLDYEARALAPRQSYSFGKPSEPLLRVARALRVLPANLPKPADPNYYINLQWDMPEQAPLLSPSVFNFFQPGYSNPGTIARAGLLSPEFQIFAETNALRQANFNLSMISWGIWSPEPMPSGTENYRYSVNYDPLVAILNTPGLTTLQQQAKLIDYLDERFLFGQMSPQLRTNITNTFAALPGWYDFTSSRQAGRAQVALYLVLNSPEFFVQK
jgi:uncharacterized protein (DUF1800 family)